MQFRSCCPLLAPKGPFVGAWGAASLVRNYDGASLGKEFELLKPYELRRMKGTLTRYTEQVAQMLRDGISEGRWRDTLPGRDNLAKELGCSYWTIDKAVHQLTREGLLISPGSGLRRKIVSSEVKSKPHRLKIMLLLYENEDREVNYMVNLLHRLQDAGYEASFAEKTMQELRLKLDRISKLVKSTKADAWVVLAGPRDVLEWFSAQSIPTFALFGRNSQVPLPSISLAKSEGLIELTDHLVALGHERIVMIAREERRKPQPGFPEQCFLDRLSECGVKTGPYNLPDWGDSPKEFSALLDSLFKYTPPTALLVSQPSLCVALLLQLSKHGLSVPKDLSLACTDASDSFEWCEPNITHISWKPESVIKRVLGWANNLSLAKEDRRKEIKGVKVIYGGTIGPAKRCRV